MVLLDDTTKTLLVIIAALLLGVIILQTAVITEQTHFQHKPIASADSIGYAIGNPVLKHELNALYRAPSITEYDRGINRWNE